MHMPNEVVGPVTATAGYMVSAAAVGYSAYKLRKEGDARTVPLLSVLSAFVFAAQMVNFPVGPSSGHLGGGVLLAALLGPYAAVLGVASVLIIQCLLFADGGVLALGLNIFNMGVVPALVYTAAWKVLAGDRDVEKGRRVMIAAVAAYVAVVLGAVLVPFEVSYSKVSMPFGTFLGLMAGIHALIGIGEALITSVVVGILVGVKPEAFRRRTGSGRDLKAVFAGVLIVALFIGAVISNFASSLPDGLEASIEKAQTVEAPASTAEEGAGEEASDLVLPTAVMPDYSTPGVSNEFLSTGLAGFIGTLITFAVAFALVKALAGRKGTSQAGEA